MVDRAEPEGASAGAVRLVSLVLRLPWRAVCAL